MNRIGRLFTKQGVETFLRVSCMEFPDSVLERACYGYFQLSVVRIGNGAALRRGRRGMDCHV